MSARSKLAAVGYCLLLVAFPAIVIVLGVGGVIWSLLRLSKRFRRWEIRYQSDGAFG